MPAHPKLVAGAGFRTEYLPTTTRRTATPEEIRRAQEGLGNRSRPPAPVSKGSAPKPGAAPAAQPRAAQPEPKPVNKGSVNVPSHLKCPFTGEPVQVIFNERLGSYMAFGPFWSTKWFNFREDLEHALSHRAGKKPTVKKRQPITATVKEEPPENPNKDLKNLVDMDHLDDHLEKKVFRDGGK